MMWLRVAPVLALADDKAAYSDFCVRMAKKFAKSTDFATMERTIKACLLRANAIESATLPAGVLGKALDDGTVPEDFLSWGWSAPRPLGLPQQRC